MSDDDSIKSETAQSLFMKAKNQNALKLAKEVYFLDKMPYNTVSQIMSPTTLITSDSESINSACGDEELNNQASQMVEYQQEGFGHMQGILVTRSLVALPPKAMAAFMENLE